MVLLILPRMALTGESPVSVSEVGIPYSQQVHVAYKVPRVPLSGTTCHTPTSVTLVLRPLVEMHLCCTKVLGSEAPVTENAAGFMGHLEHPLLLSGECWCLCRVLL
jgi:hypothetical protein